jgi:hypothetical protein
MKPTASTMRLAIAARLSAAPTFRDDQRHVVVLFLRTETANVFVNGGDEISCRPLTMGLQRLDEPSFAELLVLGVEGLGDSIGVDRQKISRKELEFRRPALPWGE